MSDVGYRVERPWVMCISCSLHIFGLSKERVTYPIKSFLKFFSQEMEKFQVHHEAAPTHDAIKWSQVML